MEFNRDKFEGSSYLIVDTETTGLFFKKDYPFLLIVTNPKGYTEAVRLLPGDNYDWLVKSRLVFHNAKFDLKMLLHWGYITVPLDDIKFDDTYLMSKLWYDRESNYQLKHLHRKYIDANASDTDRVLKQYMKRNKIESYAELPDDILIPYALDDGVKTWQLYNYYKSRDWDDELKSLYKQEVEVTRMLTEIEMVGVPVDLQRAKDWAAEISGKLLEIELPIKDVDSAAAIREYLYDKCGAECTFYTQKGAMCVSEEALEKHIDVPGIAEILRFRKLSKILHTYLDNIVKYTVDGVLYAEFNQTHAVTGRMSSSRPNLQNLPATVYEGYDIRSLIIAPDNYSLVGIDLKQIEIICTAAYIGDKKLIKALWDGMDAHQWTAELCNISRKEAKAVGFGTIYGMGTTGLAGRLNITKEEASQIRNKYFSTFPGIPRINSNIRERVHRGRFSVKAVKDDKEITLRGGIIRNLFGRKYHLFSNFPKKYRDKVRPSSEAYKGLNRLVQGTCADLFKRNALAVNRFLKGTGVRIVLFVHDEIVLLGKDEDIDKVLDKVIELFTDNSIFNNRVPVRASVTDKLKAYTK